MVYYVMAQHPDLVLLLRERKYSSLRHLFEDAEEVEENIRACKRIRDQAYFENMHAHEQQEDCEYDLDLELNSSVFSDFSMDRDTYHAYDQFLNHFEHAVTDDYIDNFIFLVDLNQNTLNPAIQLSYNQYSENETVTLGGQELLTEEQEGYLFSSKGECMYEQLSFLNQHDSDLGFEDPVVALLESYFSDSLKISDFIISPHLWVSMIL
jgi:hypothetical protein